MSLGEYYKESVDVDGLSGLEALFSAAEVQRVVLSAAAGRGGGGFVFFRGAGGGVVCSCYGTGGGGSRSPGASWFVAIDAKNSSSPKTSFFEEEHITCSESLLNACWHARFGICNLRGNSSVVNRDWFARVVQHPFVACRFV